MARSWLNSAQTSLVLLAVCCAGAAPAQIPGQPTAKTLRNIGDVILIGLPLATGAAIRKHDDRAGLRQFVISYGATVGTTFAMKASIIKSRPDGSDGRSFPSGHTSMTFAPATFLWKRYGPKYGVPAMLAAGFTGFTRVRSQKHFNDDVIAGAGIGLLYGALLTKPLNESITIQPMAFAEGGYGVTVGVDPAVDSSPPSTDPTARPFHFSFEYGAVDSRRLDIQAAPGSGTLLARSTQVRDLTPISRLRFQWMFRRPHEFHFEWAPVEANDMSTTPDRDISFGGVEFEKGVPTLSRVRFDQAGFGYRYGLIDTERFGLRVGGVLSVRKTVGIVAQSATDLDEVAEVSDYEVLPLAHARANLNLTSRFGVVAEAQGMRFSSDRWSHAEYAAVAWQPTARFSVEAGVRILNRNLRTDDLYSRLRSRFYVVGLGYSF